MKACCCRNGYYPTSSPCGCCPGNRAIIVTLRFLHRELPTDCDAATNPVPDCKGNNAAIDWQTLSGPYVLYPRQNAADPPECPSGWATRPGFKKRATLYAGHDTFDEPCPPCSTDLYMQVELVCSGDAALVLTVIPGHPVDPSRCGDVAGRTLAFQAWQYEERPRKTCLPASFKLKRPHYWCPDRTVEAMASVSFD